MNKAVLALVLLAGAFVHPAYANMGRPWSDSQPAGDPAGLIDVAIKRERLVIDLRDVPRDTRARISATYELQNEGDAKSLELVFATGIARDGVRDFQLTLDGTRLGAELLGDPKLPKDWQPPKTTPLPGGDSLTYGDYVPATAYGFRVTVPPGAHTLQVTYSAVTMKHSIRKPVVVHQLGYVLSPARTWKSFGGLDVTIDVPSGWEIAVEPALTRKGDTLTGSFASIPADAIAMTIRAPLGAYPILDVIAQGVFVLVLLGGPFWVWRKASKSAGLAWAGAYIAAGVAALYFAAAFLPDAEVDHRGYGIGVVLLVMSSPIIAILGAIIGAVAARRERRKLRGEAVIP